MIKLKLFAFAYAIIVVSVLPSFAQTQCPDGYHAVRHDSGPDTCEPDRSVGDCVRGHPCPQE